jgi:DNA-binding MarR family transcriptional regulator
MAVRLVMKRPNLTTLIDGLVVRRLVERRRPPPDRRRVDLVLTARGRKLLAAATASSERALTSLAELGGGDPRARVDALSIWGPAVEEAAALLRSTR